MPATTKPLTEAMINGMLITRDRRYRGASPIKSTWARLVKEGYITYVCDDGINGRAVLTEKGAAEIADVPPA